MEKKYIRSGKYKKTSSLERKKRSSNISKKLKQPIKQDVIKPKQKKKKTNKRKINYITVLGIILIVILSLIALRFALKDEGEPFFNFFGTRYEKNIINKLDIALVDSVDILDSNTKNVILTELNNYTSGVLLRIDEKYEIQYDLLESVEKTSNTEYVLNIKKNNSLTASVLKARILAYTQEDSKYYANCSIIKDIQVKDEKTVVITLKQENPLFIYNLQLPINYLATNTGMYTINTTRGNSDKVTYIKKDYVKDLVPQSISVVKVDEQEAIELFRANKINMFFTNNYAIGEKLGNVELDIRSYVNGDCLMLFGNKSSKTFAKNEIRQAVAYSIDRTRIKKDIYLNSGSIIDLPFIYTKQKYKYDIYGAQNILLTNGYTLVDNVFTKDGESLSLTLLVNKEDETKVKVASYIKEDLENIGIKINLKLVKASEMKKQISLGEYDLVLADVTLNENPDVSFINNFVNINENVDKEIEKINNEKNASEIPTLVNNMINTMSDEVSCIGIHADTTYVVSQRGLDVFSDISYMNIFSKLLLTN